MSEVQHNTITTNIIININHITPGSTQGPAHLCPRLLTCLLTCAAPGRASAAPYRVVTGQTRRMPLTTSAPPPTHTPSVPSQAARGGGRGGGERYHPSITIPIALHSPSPPSSPLRQVSHRPVIPCHPSRPYHQPHSLALLPITPHLRLSEGVARGRFSPAAPAITPLKRNDKESQIGVNYRRW